MKSIVSLFGGWPIGKNDHGDKLQSLDWMKIFIYMEKNWKVPTILDTGISINYMNTSQYVLMVSADVTVSKRVVPFTGNDIITRAIGYVSTDPHFRL